MKTIHLKQNEFQNNKNRLTELPITIVTDDKHKDGDSSELTRQRLEKAALYLMSVFSLLKAVALSCEGESEIRVFRTFCTDAVNHCDIGYGIANSILASASCLTEFIPDQAKDEIAPEANLDSLAAHISIVLKHPDLPESLYNYIQDGLSELENTTDTDSEQPEYIARVLRGFKKSDAQSQTETISPGFFTAQYKQTGERIERVLASDKVSNEVKNILEALVNEAANEAGFSFPETDEIALKLPKIFDALGKSKDSFVVYYNAIETALNHGIRKSDMT